MTRYGLDFGTVNAGGSPTFSTYENFDTGVALAQPAIVNDGDGLFHFDVDWPAISAVSISFKAVLAGIELAGVISSGSQVGAQGGTSASTTISSTAGYWTAKAIINRAAIETGVADEVADPFASTNPTHAQMIALLNGLGTDLTGMVSGHLQRECTLVTAGGSTSYAMPEDYVEMVDGTGWERGTYLSLSGPVTPQADQYLKAWTTNGIINIPFRLQGNRITFPLVPADGRTLTFLYVSSYWIQTAAGSAPDADHATAALDYVLFDPLLMIYGLKLRFLEAKGFDATGALSSFARRLEYVRGKVSGAPVLSLGRGPGSYHFIDGGNLPLTGWGQ